MTIADSHQFKLDTKLQAEYESSTPPQVNAGSVSVPLARSGSYYYMNCNIKLGTLTITKIEIYNSSPYNSWRFTCTGSGSWTGRINYSTGFLGSNTMNFTLSSGTRSVTVNEGSTVDGVGILASALVKGNSGFGTVSSVSMTFVSA